ncbi:MAG: hypothetical protein NTW30_05890 [Candidatus Aenigmarchaeota archaeon]|nr:hypothetical protein [Candidatus Aenigmarchaeota archaeon]
MSDIVYAYRSCRCLICKQTFTAVSDGKRHVVLTHGKKFGKARKFIETIPANTLKDLKRPKNTGGK